MSIPVFIRNSLLAFTAVLFAVPAVPDKKIITYSSTSTDRHEFRDNYTVELLKRSLEITEEQFGPYELRFTETPMAASRAAIELARGDKFSVLASTFKPKMAKNTLVVPFPIYKGLASYRFFFARKESLLAFRSIKTLDALRVFKVGQGVDWSTAKILEDNGFKVVYSGNADTSISLPRMLTAARFDLYMRGATELVTEAKMYAVKYPELTVVDDIAIYTYLPTFFYVPSNDTPLAERIYQGLLTLDKKGEIEELLRNYSGGALKLVYNSQRKVFYLPNTNLEPGMYERDKSHLLQIDTTGKGTHNQKHK